MTSNLDPLALAERLEVAAVVSLAEAASPASAAACGLHLQVQNDGLLLTTERTDVLALNRLFAFHDAAPPTPMRIADWIAQARQRGVKRLFVQVAPIDAAGTIAASIAGEGGRPYNRWVRLARSLSESPTDGQSPSAARVELLAPGDRAAAAIWAGVVSRNFGWPLTVQGWLADSVGRSGWRHYVVRDGATVLATAALYIEGDQAWFGFGTTIPEARRRGAQSALIARRIADAAALGARWAIAETAEDTAERPALSNRNLRRLGFEELYRRTNYVIELRESKT